jgi:DNA-nicking Smr family endonuclease
LNDNISDKDKRDWEDFLSSDEKLPNKDQKFKKKKVLKIRHIDLHGFTLSQANQAIKKFINDCYQNDVSKIIVVTGKGLHSNIENNPFVSKDLGILKYSVPEYIENNLELMKKIIEIKDAEIKDGGTGAFYIFLKKRK